jgi:hypothetical protein
MTALSGIDGFLRSTILFGIFTAIKEGTLVEVHVLKAPDGPQGSNVVMTTNRRSLVRARPLIVTIEPLSLCAWTLRDIT